MPPGPKKMVVGFNHNIKHRGSMYHVQTEDSGLDNPHVITHLFVGGNILASKKTSYADIAGADNLADVVRELMEEQHKEMLRNLINGVYDGVDAPAASPARVFQPGQIQADGPPPAPPPAGPPPAAPRAATPRGLRPPAPPARAMPPPIVPRVASPASPGRTLPPEVAAARQAPPPAMRDDGETIFGEDLISEKSLDEVILSYLAEDMGERKP
jgi:hypothetical protein